MYQSLPSQSIHVDIRDIYLMGTRNTKPTARPNSFDYNVKVDISQSLLAEANNLTN